MTRTFFIYDNFEIYSLATSNWKKDTHRHDFFELLYIVAGSGTHILNDNHHNYQARDIYFLTPRDIHSFKTKTPTKFHCLRFLPGFFQDSQEITILENIFNYHNQAQGRLMLPLEQAKFCESLIQQIVKESVQAKNNNLIIIRHLMAAMLEIIKRSVTIDGHHRMAQTLKIDRILQYIRSNIAFPQLLKKQEIAKRFNISEHYLYEYFKKHLHTTPQEFIIETRLHVIQEKLRQSSLSFTEISHELGFKDSSHFNKFVKQHTGKSPSKLRVALTADRKNQG
ncbi:hypothetical protein BKI52_10255 [marine bacterium AO1-C]|nr:hypothetical protein BKI52_10255 [marine bacterium AO1-C]